MNTSPGKVTTSVGRQDFAGTQTIDFDTVKQTILDQKTDVQNSVDSTTTVSSDEGSLVTHDKFSFPISVDVTFPVSTSPFGLTVATAQNYQATHQVSREGHLIHSTSVTNSVAATDVSPAASSQDYRFTDSDGTSYHCNNAAANNILTSASRGCRRDQD